MHTVCSNTPEPFKRILVFRIGQLGDSLVSVPAIRLIRANYPYAEIDVLYDHHLGKNFVPAKHIFEPLGIIRTFIPYPVATASNQKLKVLFQILRLVFRLRRKRYQAVFHLEPGQKTFWRGKRDNLFFYLAGVRRQFTSSPLRASQDSGHPLSAAPAEVDFYIEVLKNHGLELPEDGPPSICLYPTEREERHFLEWSQRIGLRTDVPLVGVGVGSKMQSKQWGLDRFYEVLEGLNRELGVCPVFLGGAEDIASASSLIDRLGVGWNACGEFTPLGSIRVLHACSFYLGNDTGTMHLAVAAGRRCVAVFSARDVPGKWYPVGRGHVVHRVPVPCEGCMLTTCIDNQKRCLTAVLPESVLESCRDVLHQAEELPPLVEVTQETRKYFQSVSFALADSS